MLIERGAEQYLNFDFSITNRTDDTLHVDAVTVSVRDRAGVLALRRSVDQSGFSPGVLTLQPDRVIPPRSVGIVFNPFFAFDPALDVATLTYEFRFERSGHAPVFARTVVRPIAYVPRTSLTLPIRGRVLVVDGHDFLSHHRRLDPTLPVAKQYGFGPNFMRYALDLAVVDVQGNLYDHARGDNTQRAVYYGFGVPVYAPAVGTVVAAYDGQPDNMPYTKNYFEAAGLAGDPMSFDGNYIVIDHGHGEYRLLAPILFS